VLALRALFTTLRDYGDYSIQIIRLPGVSKIADVILAVALLVPLAVRRLWPWAAGAVAFGCACGYLAFEGANFPWFFETDPAPGGKSFVLLVGLASVLGLLAALCLRVGVETLVTARRSSTAWRAAQMLTIVVFGATLINEQRGIDHGRVWLLWGPAFTILMLLAAWRGRRPIVALIAILAYPAIAFSIVLRDLWTARLVWVAASALLGIGLAAFRLADRTSIQRAP
jgi:hypothetical protein